MIALLYPVGITPVTQTFAQHVAQGKRNYNGGIDFAVATGTPVRDAADGQVAWVGKDDDSGYGIHVRIRHAGGYQTIYAHLLDFAVTPGQIVSAGDVIGRSDNTGNSTGPHLHFELRRNNIPIDPAPYFLAIEPEKTDVAGLRLIVSAETLNVRVGPGMQYPVVDRLRQGETVPGLRLSGETWVEIGVDRWCAMTYGQDIYLEPQHE